MSYEEAIFNILEDLFWASWVPDNKVKQNDKVRWFAISLDIRPDHMKKHEKS